LKKKDGEKFINKKIENWKKKNYFREIRAKMSAPKWTSNKMSIAKEDYNKTVCDKVITQEQTCFLNVLHEYSIKHRQ